MAATATNSATTQGQSGDSPSFSEDHQQQPNSDQYYQQQQPIRMGGKVKFFNSHKGYGFIIPDLADWEVFVHHTAIKNDGGFRSLAEGEYVEFDVLEGPKGMQAANVSGPNESSVIGDPNAGKPNQSNGERSHKPSRGNDMRSTNSQVQPWPQTMMYTYPNVTEPQAINMGAPAPISYGAYYGSPSQQSYGQWMGYQQTQQHWQPYQMMPYPSTGELSPTSSHPTSPTAIIGNYNQAQTYPLQPQQPQYYQYGFYNLVQGMNSLNISPGHQQQHINNTLTQIQQQKPIQHGANEDNTSYKNSNHNNSNNTNSKSPTANLQQSVSSSETTDVEKKPENKKVSVEPTKSKPKSQIKSRSKSPNNS
ncbi:hypothetical protein HK099_008127, partial [Clydaea vesicula]